MRSNLKKHSKTTQNHAPNRYNPMRKKIVRYLYNFPSFCQIDQADRQDPLKFLQDFLLDHPKNMDPCLNIYDSYNMVTKYDM